VTVSQVQNPPSTKESGYAQVHAFLKTNGAFYLTEHMTEAFRVQANTPNTLRSVSVQRSVAVVSQFTDLEVCFTPFNPLPQGAQVTLVTNPE
jgi:predicted methyltransferase